MIPRAAARVALGTLAVALGLAPVVVPTPAHAGQLNLTIGVQGAGYVRVVEGSLEDGGSTVCDQTQNLDHRVTLTCARVRNEEPFEAWVWLRPSVTYSPPSWEFSDWRDCDQTRERDGVQECGVGSPAFGTVSKYPVAVFRDTQAPTLSEISVAQLSTQGGFRFEWAASGAVKQECRTGAAAFVPCSSPHVITLQTGEHTLAVRAEDASGNQSPVRTAAVRSVDTYLINDRPAQLTNSRTAEFQVASAAGKAFSCALDQVLIDCTSGGRVVLHNLTEGYHQFSASSRYDHWYDPVPVRWSWTVDTRPPTATITVTEIDGGDAQFAVSAPDAARTECRQTWNGAAGGWYTCGPTVHLTGLAAGEHLLEVRAIDKAGNVQVTPASHAWTVTEPDTSVPRTTITGGPANGAIVTSSSATFTLGSSEAGSTLACSLDGRARACRPGTHAITGLAPGTHLIRARATDAAGNTDPVGASRFWTVPVPGRSLTRSSAWTLRNVARAYGGQVLHTTRKGAAVSYTVRNARRLSLVASGGTTHGTVHVYAGSRLVRTVSLKTTRSTTRRVIPITSFSSAWSGKVRIVLATSGRTVRLEGLAAPTR